MNGMKLCKDYYEKFGAPMIKEKFPEYEGRIACGHVGEGSDCFGFDDEISRDHDFGPAFSMWVTKETYKEIGEELQKAYAELPMEYEGVKRPTGGESDKRFGVCVIEDFYERVLCSQYPKKDRDFLGIDDCYLACATNGEVFRDDEGIFTRLREGLIKQPKSARHLKLAQQVALLGQNAQYNYKRACDRGDFIAAMIARTDAIKNALKSIHLIHGVYAPHDKWLYKSAHNIDASIGKCLGEIGELPANESIKNRVYMEKLSEYILELLRENGIVSHLEGDFLPDLSVEIARKGQLYFLEKEELLSYVLRLKKKQIGDYPDDETAKMVYDTFKELSPDVLVSVAVGIEYILSGRTETKAN
ncbi:MAG: DUF4037 domain-containing protein [Lachnospiraceae bacterium]|nr:DUF4037 domain-containing protein [Lachnospiraceae bacterium]